MSWSVPTNVEAQISGLNLAIMHLPQLDGSTLHFSAGSLYILVYGDESTALGTDQSLTVISGTAGSWTFHTQSAGIGAQLRNYGMWHYIPSVTEDHQLSIDPPGGNKASQHAVVVSIASGFDAATPFAQITLRTGSAAASFDVPLDAAPSAQNLSVVVVGKYGVSDGINPDAATTELGEAIGTGSTSDSGCIESSYDTALTAVSSVTVSSVSGTPIWTGFHIEVKASPAGGGLFLSVTPVIGSGPVINLQPIPGGGNPISLRSF